MRKTPRKKASRQTRKQIQVGGQTPTVFSGKNYTTYFAGAWTTPNPLPPLPPSTLLNDYRLWPANCGRPEPGIEGDRKNGCIVSITDGIFDKENNLIISSWLC